MWGYYWGFTCAEIELLAMDQPIIVYDHKNGKEKGKFKRANPLDVIRAQKEWNEKYEGKNNDPIKLDFSSFSLTQSGNNNQ